MNRKKLLTGFIFTLLTVFMLNAHAEYYIVYPASAVDNGCGSCDAMWARQEKTVYYVRQHYYPHRHHRHHYHHRIHHKYAHRRSTLRMEVYYTEHPCGGCVTRCLPVFNGIPESDVPYDQTSDETDHFYDQNDAYDNEGDDAFYNDRATTDDDGANLQIGND